MHSFLNLFIKDLQTHQELIVAIQKLNIKDAL